MSDRLPIIVEMNKSAIVAAIADGAYSAVTTLNIPGQFKGGPKHFIVKQIMVGSEEAMTTWSVAFATDSGGGDATDLDSDSIVALESLTKNVTATPTTNMNYYTNSGLDIYIKASDGTQTDANPPQKQMHIQLGPVGLAAAGGAAAQVIAKFWLIPAIGM